MLLYKDQLSKRNKAETGIRYEWYALQRWGANYWDEFNKPKIVYCEIGSEMDACIIEPDIFINNKLYMVTGKYLEYLLIFFNSKIFNKIILRSANLTGGKGVDFLNKIHCIIPDKNQMLKSLELIKPGTPDSAKEAFINSLYNLTPEETAFIEGRA